MLCFIVKLVSSDSTNYAVSLIGIATPQDLETAQEVKRKKNTHMLSDVSLAYLVG